MSGLPVRFGAVGALATPPAIIHDCRASGHFSLVADEAETHEEPQPEGRNMSSSKDEPQYLMSPTRLSPPSADYVRSSYTTSTTEDSRISGLSDFPSPPEFSSSPALQSLTPAHTAAEHSHFADDTPISDPPSDNQRNDYREPPDDVRRE